MGFAVSEKIKALREAVRSKLKSTITLRWVLNVFGPIFAIAVLACFILCIFVNSFYVMSASGSLKTEAESTSRYFETFVYPQYMDFDTSAQLLISDFDKKNIMELQVSNVSGKTTYSSVGVSLNEINLTPDVIEARGGTVATWTGVLEQTDEHVISVSVPIYNTEGTILGTIRMMSSLENLYDSLGLIYLVIWVVGISIIALTAFSGIYFIKSIVIPVRQINDVAIRIAEGNMAAPLLTASSSDEIGLLCSNINTMANRLSESQKVKNDFISQISHELRTPITAIRGWSETLMADDSLDEFVRKGATIISSEADRLSKMVEEMLDMSRMQSGRLNIVCAPFDIVAEFEDTVFMMSERSKGENVTIIYDIFDSSCIVNGDKDRLKQVFFNVIDNAIKHSDPGSKVYASIVREDSRIAFIIEDFGAGISKEDLPYIKEMFYKGSSQKRGSGIGLGVSDEIMSLHGGSLDIESEYGIGTKVTVSLPIKEELQNDNSDRPADA